LRVPRFLAGQRRRVGEEYVRQFGKLAKESTTLVVPGNLSDLASVVTMATSIVRKVPVG
jgi:hypothetical protein